MTTPLTPETLQEFSELGPYRQVGHTIVRPTTDPNDDPDHIERYVTMGSVRDAAKLTNLLNHAPDEITTLRQRVAELEAVVAKLPRTKDGVIITPDLPLYFLTPNYEIGIGAVKRIGFDVSKPMRAEYSNLIAAQNAYSTEDAALAARKEVTRD